MFPRFVLPLALILQIVAAHKEPKSAEELEIQRNLQAAAYHCSPAIAQFTAARQQAWAQKVLSGRSGTPPQISSSLPGYDDLFADGTYDGEAGAVESQQKFMSCTPVQETTMLNRSCVLAPEVTEGPYYHTVGHPIRQNIAELQQGLLLLLDIGVVDVETCEPIPNVLVDIWQANATGHYAGHPFPKPELTNEEPQIGGKRSGLLSAFPRTVHEETWLRGAFPTDQNGVVQFTSIFPGYYTGRATHIHTKVFTEWDVLPNKTFVAGRLSHVGQFFFEDELNVVVDKMHPYTENPIRHNRGRTRNWRDSLNIFEDSHGPEGKYNPVFEVKLLGGVVSQGVGAFITMGLNKSASYDNWWKG